jgi:hypothetical protein
VDDHIWEWSRDGRGLRVESGAYRSQRVRHSTQRRVGTRSLSFSIMS